MPTESSVLQGMILFHGVDMSEFANSVASLLVDREEKVAVAESVTAGEIQSAFSYCTNAMLFFEGGMVVYSVEQKIKQLHINANIVKPCEGVSDTVAADMALNISRIYETDWGVSITGYASPVPEKNIHDLFAWTALAYKTKVVSVQKMQAPNVATEKVREFYKETIFKIFHDLLRS